jgi:hypothetical protein
VDLVRTRRRERNQTSNGNFMVHCGLRGNESKGEEDNEMIVAIVDALSTSRRARRTSKLCLGFWDCELGEDASKSK